MMTEIASLLVVLVASMVDRADAVSCYQCNYTDSSSVGTSTCSEPFNATNAAKCSATMCIWQFANHTSPDNFILVDRNCANDSTVLNIDHCEEYSARFNYTAFKYGDSCCYTTGSRGDNGTTYSLSECFCQKDDCNGNVPLTLASPRADPFANMTTVTPTNTTTASTGNNTNTNDTATNSMTLLKPSMTGNCALVAVTIVLMVAKFISTG